MNGIFSGRSAGRIMVVTAVATAVTAGAATPALATQKVINRGNVSTTCMFEAISEKTYASTRANAYNECSGHGWVRIMVTGSTSYTGWTHTADSFDGAVQRPPSGKLIVKSQHKTCSDCEVFTLTP